MILAQQNWPSFFFERISQLYAVVGFAPIRLTTAGGPVLQNISNIENCFFFYPTRPHDTGFERSAVLSFGNAKTPQGKCC